MTAPLSLKTKRTAPSAILSSKAVGKLAPSTSNVVSGVSGSAAIDVEHEQPHVRTSLDTRVLL